MICTVEVYSSTLSHIQINMGLFSHLKIALFIKGNVT